MAGKTKAKPKRINVDEFRASNKKDYSPKWDDAEKLSGEAFSRHYRESMSWYSENKSSRDLKPKVIDWMGRNGYDTIAIKKFKNTKDWRCSFTMGAIAANLIKGMPEQNKDFNKGKNIADWLRGQIEKVIVEGHYDHTEVKDEDLKNSAPVQTIQDRVQETASEMVEDLDYAVDSWIVDSEKFDPKAFKIISLLKGKGVKAAHSRFIKGFYQKDLNELLELSSGKADEQLKEGYKNYSKKNVRKLIEFYESIMSACDLIAAESKVLRTPRKKKVKPAEEQVKKIKFKISDPKLNIASVPPAGIIGAQAVAVYNTKNRKMGIYISKTSNGLAVKGASIVDFAEKSLQKTLRKPEIQLRDFKDQNTLIRLQKWFSGIKTTETVLNGRINEDIIILKVFK